jgi:O-antigen ligase
MTDRMQFLSQQQSRPAKLYLWGLILFSIVCNFSISASQISLGLALIGALILWKQGKIELSSAPVQESFAFFAFAGFLSIFQAEEKLKALIEMKKFLIIFVFYLAWWPAIDSAFQRKLLGLFVFTSTLTGLISLGDVFMQNLADGRAKGFFSMSITFGECQAMAALVVITWLLAGIETKKKTFLLYFALIVISGSMLSSMTRGAWLGFLSGLVALGIGSPKRILPILTVFALVLVPVVSLTPSLRERIESFSISKNLKNLDNSFGDDFETASMQSNFERLTIWTRGFKMVEKNFVFGVGMNNVKRHYYRLATDYEKQNSSLIYGHQHNNFMQIFVMTGILGLSAFFTFLYEMFKFLGKACKSAPKEGSAALRKGALAVFLCFIVTGFTEYSWGDEEVAMMAFFLTGVLCKSNGFSVKFVQKTSVKSNRCF